MVNSQNLFHTSLVSRIVVLTTLILLASNRKGVRPNAVNLTEIACLCNLYGFLVRAVSVG
jgi:hypothetical protein